MRQVIRQWIALDPRGDVRASDVRDVAGVDALAGKAGG